MFSGDAGYETATPATAGARHRAVLEDSAGIYTHDNEVDAAYPPLVRHTGRVEDSGRR